MDRYVFAITWLRALEIWWAHTWRAMLLAMALAFASMLTYGFLSPLLRERIGLGELAIRLVLTLALVTYAFAWGMRRALQVHYADFMVEMTPVDQESSAQAPTTAAMTLWQALAVFWAMFWRAWLISFPLNLIIDYLFYGTPLPIGTIDWSRSIGQMVIVTAVTAATGTWALRIALKLDYGNWRLQLVPGTP